MLRFYLEDWGVPEGEALLPGNKTLDFATML